jgi:hypothetical protein
MMDLVMGILGALLTGLGVAGLIIAVRRFRSGEAGEPSGARTDELGEP